VLIAVGLAFVAYLVGMFPTAQMVGRRMGRDPTEEGSRNPGASNVWRLSGRRAGVLVGSVDLAKGALPTLLALVVSGRPAAHAAWVAAVAGHVWPVTRKFRGGKGVATAGGGGLVLGPLIGLACAVLFVVAVRLGRIAALGSLVIAVGYPTLAALVGRPGWEVAVACGVASILVIRHRSNIRRLVRGEETTTNRTHPT
jgi:glycerol-3-phosphate acyltransferase PlsY